MRKLISFMHLSLDGFVAGPNGEMDWITVDENLFAHIGERIAKTDTAMYGRNTYQMMEAYWPTAGDQPGASAHDISHAKWYKSIRKIVLSNTLNEKDYHNTTVINYSSWDRVVQLKEAGEGEILLFGSPSATHALMRQNLIDGYWLFLNPVLLGRGIPLFSGMLQKTKLKPTLVRQFGNGVTELGYTVESASA